MEIPEQLQDPAFRFYLVRQDSKLPLETGYNKENNYPFFHSKVHNHNGNLGLLTGYGDILVLDFDDGSFYDSVCKKLPITFTVASGKKKKPHLYYYLKHEDVKVGDASDGIPANPSLFISSQNPLMFRYFGIDKYYDKKAGCIITHLKRILAIDKVRQAMNTMNFQKWLESNGLSLKRVCDVMADGGRIICPGSSIERRYYSISLHNPIAEVTKEQLELALGVKIRDSKIRKEYSSIKPQPQKVEQAIQALLHIGLVRSDERHFNCLFHHSDGGACVHIMPDARIYCFHEQRCWKDVHAYIDEAIEGGYKL